MITLSKTLDIYHIYELTVSLIAILTPKSEFLYTLLTNELQTNNFLEEKAYLIKLLLHTFPIRSANLINATLSQNTFSYKTIKDINDLFIQ